MEDQSNETRAISLEMVAYSMNFKDLTVEERREISTKGGLAKRDDNLIQAWANQDKLRKEHKTLGMTALAKKHNISLRSTYRIVKGK